MLICFANNIHTRQYCRASSSGILRTEVFKHIANARKSIMHDRIESFSSVWSITEQTLRSYAYTSWFIGNIYNIYNDIFQRASSSITYTSRISQHAHVTSKMVLFEVYLTLGLLTGSGESKYEINL